MKTTQTGTRTGSLPVNARHRLTDIVRDTLSYDNLDDMFDGLRLIDEERRRQRC